MHFSLPDAGAGPNSDTVEQILECTDLWSGSRDCSPGYCAQGSLCKMPIVAAKGTMQLFLEAYPRDRRLQLGFHTTKTCELLSRIQIH